MAYQSSAKKTPQSWLMMTPAVVPFFQNMPPKRGAAHMEAIMV